MQIKCIAVDDEPPALELIEEYVSRFNELTLLHTFDDAVSAVDFLRNNQVDLLFIDINMPDITGIELVKALEEKPMVIFTTAYKKFAYEGFELEAIDYLLKPIDFSRFSKAVNKALEYNQYKKSAENSKHEYLFVRSEYRVVKINLSEVEYIESLEDYIKIHIANSKPVLTLMPLKKVLEKLPADKFKRIHRSYVVAVNKVRAVLNKKVQLASAVELPISESYANFVDEWMKGN